MPFCVLFFILTSFVVSFHCATEDLVSVVVIYRHGDRTPIKTYPNDPYKNASIWEEGYGQLTNIGKMQHFLLGQWLRNRYADFLPEQYSEKQVHVRSTNVDRTLMSAEVNLAGLFPPKTKQIWKNDLVWQPIPIHTVPETLDDILAMKRPCAKYTYLLETLKNSSEFMKIKQENKKLFEYLSRHAGENIDSLENMLYLYDTLLIEKLYNFTLPDWTKEVFPNKMAPWANFTFAVECYTPELARLKVGPLLNDIRNHFLNSTQNKGYKLVVYSAHDTTIANVLNGLQLFKYHCPPYGATILFELRIKAGQYFVNILYKNSTTPERLVLKNCSYDCPLDKFSEILKPLLITPTQWKLECELRMFDSFSVIQFSLFIIGLIILIIIAIFIGIRLISGTETSRDHKYTPLPSGENART